MTQGIRRIAIVTFVFALAAMTKHVISTANLVPEPSTLVLAGVSAFSVLGYRW